MNYRQEYEKWLASPALSEDERNELKAIANDEKEIENRFYGPLEFGTAGLRGTMYVGLHNMNRHVIRWATQGFANVIRAEGEEAMKKGVAICMDCRNHSMEFARAAACVMAGNGITVKLFESLRPTPELSFAVREYGCEAGINVTASHNPKEYNGYKAYWTDGSQVTAPHDRNIIAEVEKITSIDQILTGANPGNITLLGEEFDEIYLNKVHTLSLSPESVGKFHDMKIAYTPLRSAPRLSLLITAIGISFLLENGAQLLFGADTKSMDVIVPGNVSIFGTTVSYAAILTILVSLAAMAALTFLVQKTRLGKAMRAVSEDMGAAQLMGISLNKTISFTFAVGSALAGIGSVLYLCAYPQASPTMGSMLGLKAFVAAVLGGIGSIPGAMIGGMAIGLLEALVSAIGLSVWKDGVVFAILIVVLLVKPTGIMGHKTTEKV